MKWARDLFAEPGQERTSLSRFWTSVILAVSTWIVVRMELTERTSFEILGTYMGLVLGYEMMKRGARMHYETSVTRERIRSRVDDPDA